VPQTRIRAKPLGFEFADQLFRAALRDFSRLFKTLR
jgi:hypothetical protein